MMTLQTVMLKNACHFLAEQVVTACRESDNQRAQNPTGNKSVLLHPTQPGIPSQLGVRVVQ